MLWDMPSSVLQQGNPSVPLAEMCPDSVLSCRLPPVTVGSHSYNELLRLSAYMYAVSACLHVPVSSESEEAASLPTAKDKAYTQSVVKSKPGTVCRDPHKATGVSQKRGMSRAWSTS